MYNVTNEFLTNALSDPEYMKRSRSLPNIHFNDSSLYPSSASSDSSDSSSFGHSLDNDVTPAFSTRLIQPLKVSDNISLDYDDNEASSARQVNMHDVTMDASMVSHSSCEDIEYPLLTVDALAAHTQLLQLSTTELIVSDKPSRDSNRGRVPLRTLSSPDLSYYSGTTSTSGDGTPTMTAPHVNQSIDRHAHRFEDLSTDNTPPRLTVSDAFSTLNSGDAQRPLSRRIRLTESRDYKLPYDVIFNSEIQAARNMAKKVHSDNTKDNKKTLDEVTL